MSAPAQPSFTALYQSYLDAYNAKSFDGALSHLSESFTVTFQGKPVPATRPDLEKAWRDDWAQEGPPVKLEDCEDFDQGLRCTMINGRRGMKAKVVVYFAKEEGVWKQTKHELLEVEKL